MKKVLVSILACGIILSASGCSGQNKPSVQTEIQPIGGVVRLEQANKLPEFEEELPGAEEELPVQQIAAKPEASHVQEQATVKPQTETPVQPKPQEQTPVKPQAETPAKPQEQVPQKPPAEEKPVEHTKPKEEPMEVPQKHQEDTPPVQHTPAKTGEVKAVWISYLDFANIIKNRNQTEFTNNIGNAFDKVKNTGLNTVIVQVRPFGDALYDSQYFPWSYTITGTEGRDPGYDPLKIMVREAHNRGLSIEAWINPYRIRVGGYTNAISNDNIAMEWYEEENDAVIKYNGGFYYNPGSQKARDLIIKGVEEIVQNYAVDGIHFDDYFYPTTDESFDKNTYQQSGTNLSLADWRRENVNKLVKSTYSAIKNINPSVRFGISPQGNFSNNYNVQYSDVGLWMANSGYVDYICPQLYWGFKHATAPYKSMVAQWDSKVRSKDVDLYIGLATYKLGTTEAAYAKEGVHEWKNTTDLMARMVETARTANSYGGFMLFRYDSLYNPPASVASQIKTELNNLKDIL